MEQALYNKLKSELGLSDAVNEYIEVLARKIESESLSEEEFQKIATMYNIKVNNVSINDAVLKIRGYYIVGVYQILEHYFTSLNDYLNKYSFAFRKREDGEPTLKYLCYRLLDMQKVNDEVYLYYLLCDYYRLVRNYIAHVDSKRKIDNAYATIIARQNEINDKFPNLSAPNDIEEIGFDDFVLYSRSAKKLAKDMNEKIQYDLHKVAKSIDMDKYAKLKNNPKRIRKSIEYELKVRFSLKSEDIEFVVAKLMREM